MDDDSEKRSLFDVSGSVNNNSDSTLDRTSVRVFVFDGDGNLVGQQKPQHGRWAREPAPVSRDMGLGRLLMVP